MATAKEEVRSNDGTGSTSPAKIDLKFEAVLIPVAEADRAKEFYARLGWREDADFRFDDGSRILQFTPPGSGCSIQFGTKLTSIAPGSAQGLYLIVSDIESARAELVARGARVSEVFHPATLEARFNEGASGRIGGPAPDHGNWPDWYAAYMIAEQHGQKLPE
jgi:hypothetical protein